MQNNLDAIILLTTSKEIDNGQFIQFAKQFANFDKSSLKFLIFINNIKHTSDIFKMIKPLSKVFKSVEVIYVNIPTEDDIYKHSYTSSDKIPDLGFASGPNILFFSAMEHCKIYNTVLLLETDCKVKHNMVTTCIKYVKNLGDFLISGARYDGDGPCNGDNTLLLHLNGVGFYRTGHPEFHSLLQNVEQYIVTYVKQKPFLAYDYAITYYLINTLTNTNARYAKTMMRKLIPTTLIVNCSPIVDKDIHIDQVNEWFPNHVILHQK
jgi:hypothetical protein